MKHLELFNDIGIHYLWLGMEFRLVGAGQAAKHTALDMPLWFSGSGGRNTLGIFTLLGGLSHLIMAIYIFSWLKGILLWIVIVVGAQISAAIVFNDARTKNPAPPFFLGILGMLIGLVLLANS